MANLRNLISKSESQFATKNASLRYQNKSPNIAFPLSNGGGDEQLEDETPSGPLVASVVLMYRYEQSNAIDLGKKGAAIVANTDSESRSFSLICYEIKSRKLLLSATLHSAFVLNVLAKNFVAFYDSKSNYFSLRFPNDALLDKFVCAVAMAKVPRVAPFNAQPSVVVQTLNKVPDANQRATASSTITTQLEIWLLHPRKHPFERGDKVFDAEKQIRLGSDKVLPVLSKGMVGIRRLEKRLIVCSAHYGFGQKGNAALNIPSDSALLVQVLAKDIATQTETETATGTVISNSNGSESAAVPVEPPIRAQTVQTVQTAQAVHMAPAVDASPSLHAQEADGSTRARMARLSAATGGSMLATLIGGGPQPQPQPQQQQQALAPAGTPTPSVTHNHGLSSNASVTSESTGHEGMHAIQQQQTLSRTPSQPQTQLPPPQPHTQPHPHPQPHPQPHYYAQAPRSVAPMMAGHGHPQPMQPHIQPTMPSPQPFYSAGPSSSVNYAYQSPQTPQPHHAHQPYRQPPPPGHSRSVEASLSAIDAKVDSVCVRMKAWSEPAQSAVSASVSASLSVKDVIKCLTTLQGQREDDAQQISSLKLEVRALEERLKVSQDRAAELLVKNNSLMEQQLRSMSSTHDESAKLRAQSGLHQQRVMELEQHTEAVSAQLTEAETEREGLRERVNELLTELSAKETALSAQKEESARQSEAMASLQTELETVRQSVEELRSGQERGAAEEAKQTEQLAQTTKELQRERELREEAVARAAQMAAQMEEDSARLNERVASAEDEAKEILSQSKQRIERLKAKFGEHRLELIRRILEFTYSKYDEATRTDAFNSIKFWRSLQRHILSNPDDFDDEEDDDEDDSVNGEEED